MTMVRTSSASSSAAASATSSSSSYRFGLTFWLGVCIGALWMIALLGVTTTATVVTVTATTSSSNSASRTTTTATRTRGPGNDGTSTNNYNNNKAHTNNAATAAATTTKNNMMQGSVSVPLKVTFRRDSLEDAPSCVHSFGQVELLNMHPTDPIVIHSITTAFEETTSTSWNITYGCLDEVVAVEEGMNNNKKKHQGTITVALPRQIQVSRLPSSSLVLESNQIAIVPVSFLPRFPPEPAPSSSYYYSSTTGGGGGTATTETKNNSNDSNIQNPQLSDAQRLDLETWLDSGTLRRSNRFDSSSGYPTSSFASRNTMNNANNAITEEFYQVTTTVMIETSVGILEVPIQASSCRGNFYGLPDRITFPTSPSSYPTSTTRTTTKPTTTQQSSTHSRTRIVERSLPRSNGHNSSNKNNFPTRNARMGGGSSSTSGSADSNNGNNSNELSSASSADCYDLYIRHPVGADDDDPDANANADGGADKDKGDRGVEDDDLDLHVLEVIVSMPDKVSLHMKKGGNSNKLSGPMFTIKFWDAAAGGNAEGKLVVKPNQTYHYVATVCPTTTTVSSRGDGGCFSRTTTTTSKTTTTKSSSGSTERSSSVKVPFGSTPLSNEDPSYFLDDVTPLISPTREESWMGFLQVRTDLHTLFVVLEREATRTQQPQPPSSPPPPAATSNSTTSASTTATSSSAKQQHASSSSSSPTVGVGDDGGTGGSVRSDGQQPVMLVDHRTIDLRLLSSASPTALVPISVGNGGSADSLPITIMRMSAVWNVPPGLESLGFNVNLPGEGLEEKASIDFNETLVNAFFFECAVDWDKFLEWASSSSSSPMQQPTSVAEFRGTVLLRATSRNWEYDEWEAAMKANPNMDSELVVEIPFLVRLIRGKIGLIVQNTSHPSAIFWSTVPWESNSCSASETGISKSDSVSAAFFPVSQDGVRASLKHKTNEDYYVMRTMQHRMRVVSSIDAQASVPLLLLRKAEIVDTMADPKTLVSSSKSEESLCKYFNVAVLDRFVVGENNKTDMGLIELTYRFPNVTSDKWNPLEDRGPKYPVTCYLKVRTLPDTGDHMTPLIIYSGHVDLSGSQVGLRDVRRGGSEGGGGRNINNIINKNDDNESEEERTIWQHTIIGFDKVMSWLLNTKSGASFREILGLFSNKREDEQILLGRYLEGLARQPDSNVRTLLHPVLLQAGAVAQGEMEMLPLYLTNPNPVPVMAAIDVGEVEGMTITIGRDHSTGKGDGNSLLDFLPRKPHVRLVGESVRMLEPRVDKGLFQGHPVNGLRQFLLTDEAAGSFLSQFPYRTAVSLSANAVARLPMLEKLYSTYSLAEFYKSPFPTRFSPDAWNRCDRSVHPPPYGPFEKKLSGRRMPGPIIISNDGRTARRLPVCWDRDGEPSDKPKSDGTTIHLPPGGVARFDITLRAPPHSVLDKDITQFLATGLVLSTNHGESMPIFVSFDALQGKLDVSHIPSSSGSDLMGREGVIRVPMKLFEQTSLGNLNSTLKIPPKAPRHSPNLVAGEIVTHNASADGNGVALYMRSSFSRDVRLREVLSCNPWFEFELNNDSETNKVDPFRGVQIGVVNSVVSCDNPAGLPENVAWHPSFFRCVLNWLVNRSDLQPSGCGLLPTKESKHPQQEKDHDAAATQMSEVGGIDRAVRALKRALIVSEHFYGSFPETRHDPDHPTYYKSGKQATDGVVPQPLIDVVADAWDSWRTVSEDGHRTLSTSLRAVIEYISSAGDKLPARTHVLSVALQNLTVESVFQAPKLFDAARARQHHVNAVAGNDDIPGIIEFPATQVAGVSSISIPLRNPTAIPVKVRLSVMPTSDKEGETIIDPAQSTLQTAIGVDETVRNRFTRKAIPPYVQTGKTGQVLHQRRVLFRNDWWDESGGFYLSDYDGDIIRSRHNATIIAGPHAVVSLYNPSLVAGVAFLVGCGVHCAVRDEVAPADRRFSTTMGAAAALGSSIIGQRRWAKPHERDQYTMPAGGSLYTNGVGPSAFAIPYSSLDEIIIPPFGEAEIGPILFRPPGRFNTIGCRPLLEAGMGNGCESEPFEALMFLENSITGLERLLLRGRGQVERLDFVEPNPTGENDVFGNIELRHGRPTLVFPGTSDKDAKDGPVPVINEAVILNSGDVPVSITSAFLTHSTTFYESAVEEREKRSCEFHGFRVLNCTELSDGFTLAPGQNRSIFVQHSSRCKLRKEFVALNFEIDRSRLSMAKTGLLSLREADVLTKKLSRSGRARYDRANSMLDASLRERVELMIGYDMSKTDFSSCVPAMYSSWGQNKPEFDVNLRGNASSILLGELRFISVSRRARISILQMILFVAFVVVSGSTLARRSLQRISSSSRFHVILNSTKMKVNGLSSPISGSNWLAAFRCLARADPVSSDLQSLGREQVRHIVLARYRALGVHQPHCLSSAGAFNRERAVAMKPGGQIATNKEGGTERSKTLSDALFSKFRPPEQGLGRLPCELGWKVAYKRGIINDASLDASPIVSKTQLLLKRRQKSLVEESQSSEESLQEDDNSISTEGDTITSVASGATNYSEERSVETTSKLVKSRIYGGELCAAPAKVKDSRSSIEASHSINGNGNNRSGAVKSSIPLDFPESPEQARPRRYSVDKSGRVKDVRTKKTPPPQINKKAETTLSVKTRSEVDASSSSKSPSRELAAVKHQIVSDQRPEKAVPAPAPAPKNNASVSSPIGASKFSDDGNTTGSQRRSKAKTSDSNAASRMRKVDGASGKSAQEKKDRLKQPSKVERTKKAQPSVSAEPALGAKKSNPDVSLIPVVPQKNAWQPKVGSVTPPSLPGSPLRLPPGLPPPPGFAIPAHELFPISPLATRDASSTLSGPNLASSSGTTSFGSPPSGRFTPAGIDGSSPTFAALSDAVESRDSLSFLPSTHSASFRSAPPPLPLAAAAPPPESSSSLQNSSSVLDQISAATAYEYAQSLLYDEKPPQPILRPELTATSTTTTTRPPENDFDIMDFLDGVLNEANTLDEIEQPVRTTALGSGSGSGGAVMTTTEVATNTSVVVTASIDVTAAAGSGVDPSSSLLVVEDADDNSSGAGLPPVISADPWAAPNAAADGTPAFEGQSRLSAYGIIIEDLSDRGVDPQSLLDYHLDLFADLSDPAAAVLLSASAAVVEGDDNDDDNGVSFYSHLLGE